VHTDLLRAGRIEDPYYRDNEDRLQWVGQKDWAYALDFDVPADVLVYERVLLHCDGLDTFATLTLNGRKLGRTDNMFRTWEFDVKGALRAGRNHIEIHFESVIPYITKMQKANPLLAWKGPKDVNGGHYVRKEPCNFGWDWGPCLVTCGIWRPIKLVAFNTARLADVNVRQDHSHRGKVFLDIAVAAEVVGSGKLAAGVSVMFAGKCVAQAAQTVVRGRASLRVEVPDAQLWWPAGMGDQPLYTVEVELVRQGGEGLLDMVSQRIGLRTLRLHRQKDQWGECFEFVANGVAFFAKGANWIPADTFAPRVTRAMLAKLLNDAVAANMNMLRVWGGGIYEEDAFYDLCDELGICVWQDFMFACATYPTYDDKFLASVRAEAEDNVRRLRGHACMALWCGNNELEPVLIGRGWADYGRLFDKLLPKVCAELSPDIDYWPSSPHTPLADRGNSSHPGSGDAHLWQIWHGRKPFEDYRTMPHRFVSEFGFQSYPEPRTVATYTAPADRNVTSHVMEHHQRSPIGNSLIMMYMLDWFRCPTDFDSSLWLSQIVHGLGMQYGVEHWRRSMPRCMGTLYWQINDCWPVASWASIDSLGRWKALHFMARRFYAPVLISAVEDAKAQTLEIHVTSDLDRAFAGQARWRATDLTGKELAHGLAEVKLPPRTSRRIETVAFAKLLAKHDPKTVIVWLELVEKGAVISSNRAAFAKPKHMDLLDPQIKPTVKAGADGTFEITLRAKHPALWAWLELTDADAEWSDNFIDILPGRPVTVTLTPTKAMTLAQVKAQLKVSSLVDTY
jgi:beta-mannosidase